MNDYKELMKLAISLRNKAKLDAFYAYVAEEDTIASKAADAIEQLAKEINYCPTDTLRKYHAWLLEQFHNNLTSEILHSIDIAIGWLKAYAECRDINVSFGVENGEVPNETRET